MVTNGFVGRIASVDSSRLCASVDMIVGLPCWTTGGALFHDLDRTPQLRPIQHIMTIQDLEIHGTIGHAFSSRAEVRWKRYGSEQYDMLILSDMRPDLPDIEVLGEEWRTQFVRLVSRSREQSLLGAVMYYAPNGAVQFIRYAEEVILAR